MSPASQYEKPTTLRQQVVLMRDPASLGIVVVLEMHGPNERRRKPPIGAVLGRQPRAIGVEANLVTQIATMMCDPARGSVRGIAGSVGRRGHHGHGKSVAAPLCPTPTAGSGTTSSTTVHPDPGESRLARHLAPESFLPATPVSTVTADGLPRDKEAKDGALMESGRRVALTGLPIAAAGLRGRPGAIAALRDCGNHEGRIECSHGDQCAGHHATQSAPNHLSRTSR